MRESRIPEGMNCDDYAPACRVGGDGTRLYADKSFDDVEDKLAEDYQHPKGESRLELIVRRREPSSLKSV